MTLAPYLSLKNFQVSVSARLNADKVQTNETVFNPDQRVERSVRTVKEKTNSQNNAGTQPAGVQTNLPEDQRIQRRHEAVFGQFGQERRVDELRNILAADSRRRALAM